MTRVLLLLLLALVIGGCAPTIYDRARVAVDRGDPESALALLVGQVQRHPDDAEAIRELGIVQYQARRYEDARRTLVAARRLNYPDLRTLLYLGLTYESFDQPDSAILAYRQCAALPGPGRDRNLLDARIRRLSSRKLRQEIRRAMQEETRLAPTAPPATLAVLPFVSGGASPEQEVRIGRAMALLLATDLSHVSRLTVLERVRLNILIDEIAMGRPAPDRVTATVDPPRAGRLLGAGTIISGTVLDVGAGTIRVNAASVPAAGGPLRPELNDSERLDLLFDLEKRLAFGLLDQMEVTPTPDEAEQIRKYRPTTSLEALLDWADGLYYLDTGNLAQAQGAFQRAIEIDPGFREPRQGRDEANDEVPAMDNPTFSGIAEVALPGSDLPSLQPEPPLEGIMNQVGGSLAPSDPEQAEPRPPGISDPPPPPPPPPAGGGNRESP